MSIQASAIGEGTVTRLTSQEVVSMKTGSPVKYTFNSFLLIGQDCMLDIRVPDKFDMPVQGAKMRCRVVLSSFRDEDQTTLDAYL